MRVWVPRDLAAGAAVFAIDIENGKGWYGQKAFSSEAEFLTASGGVKYGTTYTFGPYGDPDAPELVVNGDFSNGTTGWSPIGMVAIPTLSVVDGALQVDLSTEPTTAALSRRCRLR